ncbi:MAG: hypothetical protein OXS30_01420 [Chloroflexota bacterium]|nr:hypothetical protein [Chloroflexota bacterium]
MAAKSTYDKIDVVLEMLETTAVYLRDELQRKEWEREVSRLKWSLYENTGREGSMSGNTGDEKGGYLSKRMIPVYFAHGTLLTWAVCVALIAWGVWSLLSGRVPEEDTEIRAAILTGVVAGGFFMAKRSIEAIRGLATQIVVSLVIRPIMGRLPGIGFAAWVQMTNSLGVSSYTFNTSKSGEEEQLKRLADAVDQIRQRSNDQLMTHSLLYDDPSYWTKVAHNGQSIWVHVPGTPAGVHIPYVRYFPMDRSTGESWRCSCGFAGDYPSTFEDLREHLEENGIQHDIHREQGLTWTETATDQSSASQALD